MTFEWHVPQWIRLTMLPHVVHNPITIDMHTSRVSNVILAWLLISIHGDQHNRVSFYTKNSSLHIKTDEDSQFANDKLNLLTYYARKWYIMLLFTVFVSCPNMSLGRNLTGPPIILFATVRYLILKGSLWPNSNIWKHLEMNTFVI